MNGVKTSEILNITILLKVNGKKLWCALRRKKIQENLKDSECKRKLQTKK